MLQQIKEHYGDFHDALITEFKYTSNFKYQDSSSLLNPDEIEIYISCFNSQRNYERDLIKITCKDIIHSNFRKHEGMIFQALLKNDDGIVVLDFFPSLWANSNGIGLISKEEINSDCIVKCKEVKYQVIE